ncbi:protein misato homolog 1 isoform X1, partial [Tachysurus ichikawai]
APLTVMSLPVMSSLQSSSSVSSFLAELQVSCSAIDLRRVSPSFLSHGDQAEIAESLEQLRTLAHCYRDDSGGMVHSYSDDDDDDDDDDD